MARGAVKATRPLGREHWQRVVDDYEASGKTQSAFAQERGISVWTLRGWLRRFREENLAQLASKKVEGTPPTSLDDVLVAAARRQGHLTTGQVAEALQVRPSTARRYLRWLVEEGRLRMIGRKRGTRYVPVARSARS